jgi:hypothetical protein
MDRPLTLFSTLIVALVVAACSSEAREDGGMATDTVASQPGPAEDTDTGDTATQDDPDEEDNPLEGYQDRAERRLNLLAAESRPVEPSAMPPRHLDEDRFPESLVDRTRIVSGGPPPDGIPSIDDPRFESADEVDWISDDEAVLALRVGEVERAYPIRIMTWHEIVNDVIGDVPVAVTYCPLCNSAVAFDRRADGEVLDFGTSGALYLSALVMYDRQTETLWTHFDGRAVVGTMVGTELEVLPVATVSWRDFREANPTGEVLSLDTGYDRPYGRNPYVGYDQAEAPLTGFFTLDIDARQAAMQRVVGVVGRDEDLAIPTDRLRSEGTVAAELDGRPISAWHLPGTASPLQGNTVDGGDDIGATGVFYTDDLGDGSGDVRFVRDGEVFVDDVTGSRWNLLGEAVGGPLAGRRLERATHLDTFWFAWSSYRPETTLLS